MSIYDLLKRLKVLEAAERSVQKDEREINKTAVEYRLELDRIRLKIRDKEELFSKNKFRLQHLQKQNDRLTDSKCNLEDELEKFKEEVPKMQEEYEQLLKDELEIKENLHTQKEVSQVFINMKRLRETVQGMCICNQHQERQWIPFYYPRNEYRTQEIPALIWKNVEQSNVYSQQWNDLIFGGTNTK